MCPYRITLFISFQTPAHQETSKSNFKYLYKQNMNTKEHALARPKAEAWNLKPMRPNAWKYSNRGRKKRGIAHCISSRSYWFQPTAASVFSCPLSAAQWAVGLREGDLGPCKPLDGWTVLYQAAPKWLPDQAKVRKQAPTYPGSTCKTCPIVSKRRKMLKKVRKISGW